MLIGIKDILHKIMYYFELDDLEACSRVNRFWKGKKI